MSPDLSLYLHVPFCLSKCPYCDFYSAAVGALGVEPEEYFQLVAHELERLCFEDKSLPRRRLVTLYFGGGTPSLVDPGLYRRFFEHLRNIFELARRLECTLEVNPGTVEEQRTADNGRRTTDNEKQAAGYRLQAAGKSTDRNLQQDRLDEFLRRGVNRLSVGVQSFSDETLAGLGRAHRSTDTRMLLDRLRRVSASGNLTWGIDLIFGAPGQAIAQWENDLDAAIRYEPHHISVYGMTVHEGTPFGDLRQAGRLELPDEESLRAMFLLARRRLIAAGYEHYEISNYAQPGFRSRHNERYWTGGDYLGLGVAAHSFVGGVRWSNPANLAHYRENLKAGRLPRQIEPPPQGRARWGEQVMLGLRRLEGMDLAEFREQFGADLAVLYGKEIARLADAGLIEVADGRLRLTEEGLLVADAVTAEFF